MRKLFILGSQCPSATSNEWSGLLWFPSPFLPFPFEVFRTICTLLTISEGISGSGSSYSSQWFRYRFSESQLPNEAVPCVRGRCAFTFWCFRTRQGGKAPCPPSSKFRSHSFICDYWVYWFFRSGYRSSSFFRLAPAGCCKCAFAVPCFTFRAHQHRQSIDSFRIPC